MRKRDKYRSLVAEIVGSTPEELPRPGHQAHRPNDPAPIVRPSQVVEQAGITRG